jgi:hypothetical protein
MAHMSSHPPWRPTTRDLDDYARTHIEYETRMLLHQVRFLFEIFPAAPTSALGDALIEAPIVHLRLFDDFFRIDKPQSDDVVATHWNTGWKSRQILTKAERDEVNQHAHLVARRGAAQAWQPRLPWLAATFCDVLEEFVNSLPPQRAAAFSDHLFHVAEYRGWKLHRGL